MFLQFLKIQVYPILMPLSKILVSSSQKEAVKPQYFSPVFFGVLSSRILLKSAVLLIEKVCKAEEYWTAINPGISLLPSLKLHQT